MGTTPCVPSVSDIAASPCVYPLENQTTPKQYRERAFRLTERLPLLGTLTMAMTPGREMQVSVRLSF